MQWAWGLDAHHDTETGVPPERVNENTTRVGTLTNGWRLARRRIMGAETRQPDDATRH